MGLGTLPRGSEEMWKGLSHRHMYTNSWDWVDWTLWWRSCSTLEAQHGSFIQLNRVVGLLHAAEQEKGLASHQGKQRCTCSAHFINHLHVDQRKTLLFLWAWWGLCHSHEPETWVLGMAMSTQNITLSLHFLVILNFGSSQCWQINFPKSLLY